MEELVLVLSHKAVLIPGHCRREGILEDIPLVLAVLATLKKLTRRTARVGAAVLEGAVA